MPTKPNRLWVPVGDLMVEYKPTGKTEQRLYKMRPYFIVFFMVAILLGFVGGLFFGVMLLS